MSASLISSDVPLRRQLRALLEPEGFTIREAASPAQAVDHLRQGRFRLIVLDLESAPRERHEAVRALKRISRAPLIVLSRTDDDADVVSALEHGADDFIVTPFNPGVLLARIYANLRMLQRLSPPAADHLVNGPVRIDPGRHEVRINGHIVSFSPKEFGLLRQLMIHKGEPVSNQILLRHIWGDAHTRDDAYLRVYISQIRKKLKPANLQAAISSTARKEYRMDVLADGAEGELPPVATH